MTDKQNKRTRRQVAQEAARRKQWIRWGSLAAVLVVGIGAFVMFGGDSGDSSNQPSAVAQNFELETNTGQTVNLSDYRGQPVAVTFMHTF